MQKTHDILSLLLADIWEWKHSFNLLKENLVQMSSWVEIQLISYCILYAKCSFLKIWEIFDFLRDISIIFSRFLSSGRESNLALFYAHSFFQMSVLIFLYMEQWENIEWFWWLYQVSDQWNVKSLYDWRRWVYREKMLKPWVNSVWYFCVVLSCEFVRSTKTVHRLVAEAFIPNPLNLPCINHKDWNKLNCHKDNLEWCTHSENLKHAFRTWLHIHFCTWKFWKDNQKSKAVIQYTKDWNLLKEWWSQKDIERILWLCHSDISRACRWIRKTCGWFIWKYKNPTE